MAFPRSRPTPPARMVELLAVAKRELLAEAGAVTDQDFEAAWDAAWAQMVRERAWPHPTQERRSWRAAMTRTRPEFRACFLGEPTPFYEWQRAILAPVEDAGLGDAIYGIAVG